MGGLRRAATQPGEELDRWQHAARYAYDLGRYGARQLEEDRAPQMAAALAFHSLFGLAPVLIVATILVKAFVGGGAIVEPLHKLLVAAGLDRVQIIRPGEAAGAPEPGTTTLAQWLEELTSQLTSVNLSAIGWLGVAVIIYAAIGLMVTIENSFNVIYRAGAGRPWTRRVPLYWFLLTVSPLMVVTAAYVNTQFSNWIASLDAWQSVLNLVRIAWSVGVAWVFMFAVYSLVPNTSVELRPALVGAFVAAVLLEVGENTLLASLGGAFSINQLYGSLGLIPLFMFWIYLMWLAVLFGLQVSAALQLLKGRKFDEMRAQHARVGMNDPASVIALMEAIAVNFAAGQPTSLRQIAEQTGMVEPLASRIVERLVAEKYLHRVEAADQQYALARPPADVAADELLAIGFAMVDQTAGCRSATCRRLRDAQLQLAAGMRLAETPG
jgi:membrane protein